MWLLKVNLKNKNIIQRKSVFRNFFLSKPKPTSKLFTEQIANNLAARMLDSASAKKSFDRWVWLTIPAGGASMLPPVGPFLGQHGFNTLNFCTTFNNMTKIYPDGLPIRVNIKLFTDKTLVFELKTPPTSFLLYSCYLSNNRKGLTLVDLLKITLIKRVDHSSLSNLSMLSAVVGTLWSANYNIS